MTDSTIIEARKWLSLFHTSVLPWLRFYKQAPPPTAPPADLPLIVITSLKPIWIFPAIGVTLFVDTNMFPTVVIQEDEARFALHVHDPENFFVTAYFTNKGWTGRYATAYAQIFGPWVLPYLRKIWPQQPDNEIWALETIFPETYMAFQDAQAFGTIVKQKELQPTHTFAAYNATKQALKTWRLHEQASISTQEIPIRGKVSYLRQIGNKIVYVEDSKTQRTISLE